LLPPRRLANDEEICFQHVLADDEPASSS
jgi:hypothetical protein